MLPGWKLAAHQQQRVGTVAKPATNWHPVALYAEQPLQVLKQRLRQMEIELVKLRAEQAERLKEGAQRRHELSTAAKLE